MLGVKWSNIDRWLQDWTIAGASLLSGRGAVACAPDKAVEEREQPNTHQFFISTQEAAVVKH